MRDAFGVERISKTGVGAGRYVAAVDLKPTQRAFQLARLRAKKPQVTTVIDQRIAAVRAKDTKAIPGLASGEVSEKVIHAARSKPGTPVKNGKKHTTTRHPMPVMDGMPKGTAAFVLPDPAKNANYLHAPKVTSRTLRSMNRHEEAHAKVKPRRLANAVLRTRRSRMGEEARADAAGFGGRRVPTDYAAADDPAYKSVYRKITGKTPTYTMTSRTLRDMGGASRSMARAVKRRMKDPAAREATRRMANDNLENGLAMTRRSPGEKYRYVPNRQLP